MHSLTRGGAGGVIAGVVSIAGPWTPAELASALNDTTWRQWTVAWEATPGRHQIACRATDGDGVTQTETRTRPIPNGASGWHSIVVFVDG